MVCYVVSFFHFMSSITLFLILKGKNSHLILLNFLALIFKRQGNSGYDLIFKILFPRAFVLWFLFIFLVNTISSGRLNGSDRKICFQREGRENVFLFFLPPSLCSFISKQPTALNLFWNGRTYRLEELFHVKKCCCLDSINSELASAM